MVPISPSQTVISICEVGGDSAARSTYLVRPRSSFLSSNPGVKLCITRLDPQDQQCTRHLFHTKLSLFGSNIHRCRTMLCRRCICLPALNLQSTCGWCWETLIPRTHLGYRHKDRESVPWFTEMTDGNALEVLDLSNFRGFNNSVSGSTIPG